MRILGIDPGTSVVGHGCVSVTGGTAPRHVPLVRSGRVRNLVRGISSGGARVRLVAAGALRLGERGTPLADRLLRLAEGMAALLAELEPDEVVLEQAFYGKSVASALRIGEARGVVLAEARRFGAAVHQVAPARVKRVVAGHGAAGKARVADMVRRSLGLARPPEPADAADALAVALCRYEELRGFSPGLSCKHGEEPV